MFATQAFLCHHRCRSTIAMIRKQFDADYHAKIGRLFQIIFPWPKIWPINKNGVTRLNSHARPSTTGSSFRFTPWSPTSIDLLSTPWLPVSIDKQATPSAASLPQRKVKRGPLIAGIFQCPFFRHPWIAPSDLYSVDSNSKHTARPTNILDKMDFLSQRQQIHNT